MNDVLDPAPLFIRESLIVGLESLDVGAVVTVLRLVIESHGFDHAADDSAFGALDGWFNVARGVPGQGLEVLAGQFHAPGGAAVDVQ